MVSNASGNDTSTRSNRIASPIRMPVTSKSPMMVS